jgi:hypothetical protein
MGIPIKPLQEFPNIVQTAIMLQQTATYWQPKVDREKIIKMREPVDFRIYCNDTRVTFITCSRLVAESWYATKNMPEELNMTINLIF